MAKTCLESKLDLLKSNCTIEISLHDNVKPAGNQKRPLVIHKHTTEPPQSCEKN